MRTNELKVLVNATGEWVCEKYGIVAELENYFYGIFSTSLPEESDIAAVLEGVDRRVTPEICELLDAPFTAKDVYIRQFFTGGHGSHRELMVFKQASIRIIGIFWARMSLRFASMFSMVIDLIVF